MPGASAGGLTSGASSTGTVSSGRQVPDMSPRRKKVKKEKQKKFKKITKIGLSDFKY